MTPTRLTGLASPLCPLGPGVGCEGRLVREHAPPLVVNCGLWNRQIVVPPTKASICSLTFLCDCVIVLHLIVFMLSKSPTKCLGQEGITIPFLGLLSCAEIKLKHNTININ